MDFGLNKSLEPSQSELFQTSGRPLPVTSVRMSCSEVLFFPDETNMLMMRNNFVYIPIFVNLGATALFRPLRVHIQGRKFALKKPKYRLNWLEKGVHTTAGNGGSD